MTRLRTTLAAAALMCGIAPAAAQEVTLDVLHCFPGFSRFHEPIAEAFKKENPGVGINFLAPCASYDEGHQQMLRSAVTNNLPDIYFAGFHLLGELAETLAARGQIADLGPYLEEAGAAYLDENFDPKILALGEVGGVQYGMPVNASSPIMYFNTDLVRRAGGDPEAMPTDWNDVLELAAKIDALDAGVNGIAYDIHAWPDDWLWQALIYQQGGRLIDKEAGTVAFDNETGLNALRLARRLVTEGGMELLDWDQSRQQFGAGLTGIIFSTPAHLQTIEGLVGDRFELGTALFPRDDAENGGVPTGGNAAVILSADDARRQAAWDYVRFATGPEAQTIVVKIAGYLPTNKLALGDDYLAPYYEANPNAATVSRQMHLSLPWEGYPGGESVRIWRAQRDVVGEVMRGTLTPEDGLARIVEATQSLMQ